MNKINLLMQEPIKFNDVCIIYQPTFDEILKYGVNEFDKLLLPYSITLDNINVELTEEQRKELKNFDLLGTSQEIIAQLFVSLEFFCRTKIDYDERGIIFEGFQGRLNRDNFDEFAELILEICSRSRPQPERVPQFKAEKGTPEYEEALERWKQLQEGRRRSQERNTVKMEDIINICEFGGNSYIPIEEIRKWSLWRIMNCYKSILGMSSYKDSFSIFLVGGDKALIEDKHWTDLIKVG
jgi:hypothetical protein